MLRPGDFLRKFCSILASNYFKCAATISYRLTLELLGATFCNMILGVCCRELTRRQPSCKKKFNPPICQHVETLSSTKMYSTNTPRFYVNRGTQTTNYERPDMVIVSKGEKAFMALCNSTNTSNANFIATLSSVPD
jgi:hypothetical protein